MDHEKIILGKLILAICAFPFFEIGVVGVIHALRAKKVSFMPRVYLFVPCVASLIAALWMISFVAIELGIFRP